VHLRRSGLSGCRRRPRKPPLQPDELALDRRYLAAIYPENSRAARFHNEHGTLAEVSHLSENSSSFVNDLHSLANAGELLREFQGHLPCRALRKGRQAWLAAHPTPDEPPSGHRGNPAAGKPTRERHGQLAVFGFSSAGIDSLELSSASCPCASLYAT